jgi:hypothetical protein
MIARRGLTALAALALPLLVGASGCHTFKYVDMTVSFDESVDDADILTIARCRVYVTGADSHEFILDRCPNHTATDPHTVGEFEYATFADSGTLNFEIKAFNGLNDTPDCQIGDGTSPVAVTSMTTLMGAISIKKSGTGCANGNVSPPTDGGM